MYRIALHSIVDKERCVSEEVDEGKELSTVGDNSLDKCLKNFSINICHNISGTDCPIAFSKLLHNSNPLVTQNS